MRKALKVYNINIAEPFPFRRWIRLNSLIWVNTQIKAQTEICLVISVSFGSLNLLKYLLVSTFYFSHHCYLRVLKFSFKRQGGHENEKKQNWIRSTDIAQLLRISFDTALICK